MLLRHLLQAILTEQVHGADDIAVTGVCCDSRHAAPGNVFVAVTGPTVDGHDYIQKALDAGCTAIVCDRMPVSPAGSATWIRVADSAVALALLASEWYGNPSRKLTLVGVTGTNGKTTVATLLYQAARLRGLHAGLLSTVENRIDDDRYPTANTTPSPLETNRLLAEMVERGCQFAAMEVSSHGVVQHRIDGLHFAGGIFTNLTRDHLDYHKTFDNYLRAKKTFFDMLPASAFALVNADDANGAVMVQNTAAKKYTYSLRSAADFTAKIIESRIDGTLLRLAGIDTETRLTGRFNAANLLAVFAAEVLMGVEPAEAARIASCLVPVAGRFETFTSPDGVTVIVDYAHTPDALANVLAAINAVRRPTAKVTVVTGAGGNRDHGKRPQMGREAARGAARLIITSDNPRDENPEDIADDIAAGVPVDSPCRVDTILERAAAIHVAVTEADPGDIVLVAGKGHEDYQEFENHRRIHFDDREQARRALASRSQNFDN